MVHNLYTWDALHKNIFNDFIQSLNEHQIRFFILRNYEGLPETNTSKDVDMIVEPGNYLKSRDLLLNVFKRHSISNYYIVDFERAHCCFGIDLNMMFSIHIDLIEGYVNKGYEILEFEELYSNTINYKGFRVLNDTYDALMLMLYKLIGCKELKPSYWEKIKGVYSQERNEINKVIIRIFSEKIAAYIIDCLDNGDADALIKISQMMGRDAKRRVLVKRPVRTIFRIWKFYSEKFHRIIICPASIQKMLAVEAPDGTGKTTFIDNLKIELAKYFVCDVSKTQVYHFRPSLLPNLGAAGEKIGVMKEDKDFTNPHRSNPSGFLLSLCRMIYYWMDYFIGAPFLLRKNARFDKITIFDRYIYDFLVDPFRSRINLPKWLRGLFVKLVKEPQIVFVLHASVATIYRRKQELTQNEISRQLAQFDLLLKRGDRFIKLDAEQTPEEIVNQAMQHIIKKFTLPID